MNRYQGNSYRYWARLKIDRRPDWLALVSSTANASAKRLASVWASLSVTPALNCCVIALLVRLRRIAPTKMTNRYSTNTPAMVKLRAHSPSSGR